MNTILGCDASGKMTFTGGCDMIDGCTTSFEATIYTSGCCDCEPTTCECSPTTVNGLSGAVVLTSPDNSVTIETNGQDVELVVSGFQPLIPDYSATPRLTGRKWVDGRDIYEVVVSGIPPAPGGALAFAPNLNEFVLQILKTHFLMTRPQHGNFYMPIPYLANSGMDQSWNPPQGQWTVHGFEVPPFGLQIEASDDADDFSNPNDGYVIYGIVEYTRIT